DVEAQPPAFGQHGSERRDVDRVLPLVVGRATTIEALAFDRDRPRREPGAPLIVEAADGVAVAVQQYGERGAVLGALRHQERRSERVVEHTRVEAERSNARRDLVIEIAAQRRGPFRLLAAARERHAPSQVDEKLAAVEIGVGAGDCSAAAHARSPGASARGEAERYSAATILAAACSS